MPRCVLCFIKKTTKWYKDMKRYAILDCPVCGEKLVISKNHNEEGFGLEAKGIAETFLKAPITVIKNRCFNGKHPYLHFKADKGKIEEDEEQIITKDSKINTIANYQSDMDYLTMHHDQ